MHRSIASGNRRRAVLLAVGALMVWALAGACSASTSAADPAGQGNRAAVVDGRPLRAFTPVSWWNAPVPVDAPRNPRSAEILDYMRTAPDAGQGCVRLAGAQDSPWGQPVYWSQPSDPAYDVAVRIADDVPELRNLRIPRGAAAAGNNDGSMTVFDVQRGYAVAFTDARYDAFADRWSATGATVTYLNSNGLDVRTGMSSDRRNLGSHRGNNPAVMMVRRDEVSAGRIEHVLKVASGPEVSQRHVFPMVGSDGDSMNPAAPPQGLRFRIKPAVDLESLGLDPEALVIATALQEYGMYIGDSAGVTALKLEDTRAEGRGQLWSLPPTALCGLPLGSEYWDVLPEGYRPSEPAAGGR